MKTKLLHKKYLQLWSGKISIKMEQTSTSLAPCLRPDWDARPYGSTSVMTPSCCTLKPSSPAGFRRSTSSYKTRILISTVYIFGNRSTHTPIYIIWGVFLISTYKHSIGIENKKGTWVCEPWVTAASLATTSANISSPSTSGVPGRRCSSKHSPWW